MTARTSDIRGDDPYGKGGDAITFLQTFDPNGWHHLAAFDPFSGKPIDACTFGPSAWGKMANWINGHIEQHNLYFSVGEPKPGSPNKKLAKQDIGVIRALFADIDPEGGAEEFDGERARIRLRVEELLRGPLPPSFVIDSGGGMQLFWKLDEPIEADAASQERVENIGRAIAHALKADAVQNIDRVMRLPGTTNFPNAKKRRKGRTVRPTLLTDASGIQHGIDDITREFPTPARERARSRAEAAVWAKFSNRIDHEEVRQLDAYDDLPGDLIERFDKLLADDAKLRAMWEHGEKEEGGRTGSDYVYALGMSLHWLGFSIEDFARLARIWRFTPGNSGRDVNASPRAIGSGASRTPRRTG